MVIVASALLQLTKTMRVSCSFLATFGLHRLGTDSSLFGKK